MHCSRLMSINKDLLAYLLHFDHAGLLCQTCTLTGILSFNTSINRSTVYGERQPLRWQPKTEVLFFHLCTTVCTVCCECFVVWNLWSCILTRLLKVAWNW